MTIPAIEPAARIRGIALVVSDLDRAVAFYRDGLGFALVGRSDGDAPSSVEAELQLGGVALRLTQYARPGAPYPAGALANDPWFQHFAIRVTDMDDAYARLLRHSPTAISVGGPQQLPPSTGSVIAYKFRDPDGHPLELSFVPGDQPASGGSPFVTIDHSAITVADLNASIDFYARHLGLVETERLLNEGPTQWRLDGLDGALVDIVILRSPLGGPHLELLHYCLPKSLRKPLHVAQHDIAATKLLVDRQDALFIAAPNFPLTPDPDGHLVEFEAS